MRAEPIDRRRRLVHAEVLTPVVDVVAGHPAAVHLRITNLDTLIRAFDVAVLGLDPGWVTVTPSGADLFPQEEIITTVTIELPEGHPAGRHNISLQITGTGDVPVVVDVVLQLAPQDDLHLMTEPSTLEMGAKGTFLLHLVNTGNTLLDVDLLAQDPERLVTVSFDPARPRLEPGSRAVVQGTASGPRPWVGMPVVRVLEVSATAGDTAPIGAVALIQSPRISRRLIAFLGLLAMVSLFALVINQSFSRVADLAERNEALVRQGLGFDEAVGARADPMSVAGTVQASTGGPIDGAAVELYEQDNPLRPVQTTVTDAGGLYRFSAVAPGDYLIRTVVAGFGAQWHPGVTELTDAEPVTVEDGAGVDGLVAELSGRPGGVSGLVLGEEVEGALLTVQLPATSVEGSTLEPVASVVEQIEIDATGRFELGGLPTPATYEILVSKPGFAEEVRTVTLGAGELREDIEILLGRGIGVIQGTVVNSAGAPQGGVDIVATDGTSETRTRSLGGSDGTGSFELRDLDVPATWTLTFSAPGFFTETRTVQVQGADGDGLTVVLTADGGSLGGTVFGRNGNGIGNATIVVTGGELERRTRTVSVGDVGRWFVGDLPAPGTYTVTASGPGLVTTAVSVELEAGAAALRSDVDFRLVPALASVTGQVLGVPVQADGESAGGSGSPEGLSGVEILLEGSGIERRTVSSDDPVGDDCAPEQRCVNYAFDRLPAGVYTLTYRRPGSTVQTVLVELSTGEAERIPDVVLEAQAGITGKVTRDGAGASDVGVLLYRADSYPEDVVASTVTAQDGTFSITGVDAPQRYIVEFRVPVGGSVVQSRTVDLAPGELENLEVSL